VRSLDHIEIPCAPEADCQAQVGTKKVHLELNGQQLFQFGQFLLFIAQMLHQPGWPFHLCVVREKRSQRQCSHQRQKKSAEFAFGKVIKSQGSKSEPVAIGKLSAPHVGRFAPITPLALPTDLGQRCRRKSKSMGAYPERPLLPSSSECIGNLSIEAEDTQAWQSSPKRRSINQTDQNEKEASIKKPRCSLPRSFCAGGA